MISWLVFRMIEAHDKETRAWRVHSSADCYVVEDMSRDLEEGPVDSLRHMRPSFNQYRFETTADAAAFLRYQAFKASLMAILKPWRKI